MMETAPNPLVLIAEDDPRSRSISSELLADEGFATANARDGETGLSLAERLRPAAIVFGLGLPPMTGSEFLRRLRGRASLVTTPVIVVSGQPAELSQEATALADGSLQTPVDLSQLMQQLKAVVAPHDGDAIGVGPAHSGDTARQGISTASSLLLGKIADEPRERLSPCPARGDPRGIGMTDAGIGSPPTPGRA